MATIDFNLHKIYVEGSTDQACVEKILELRYSIIFPLNGVQLKDGIISCNGWGNLKNQPTLVDNFRKDNGGKNLIIFDADHSGNEGGFKKRYEQIETIAKQLKVKFEIFLLPNNEENGVLEDFYCSCFKKNMKFFEECWSKMINCFKENNISGLTLKLPGVTGKVYSYVDLFEAYQEDNYENKKTKRNYFDKGLWEFDFETNAYLKKLITFIENCSVVKQ